MRREVFVHLEHGHLVPAEDSAELVIGHDFAAVLRVLQVVRTDVLPGFCSPPGPGAAGPSRSPRPAPPTRCGELLQEQFPTLTSLAFFTCVLVAIDLLQGCLRRGSPHHACTSGLPAGGHDRQGGLNRGGESWENPLPVTLLRRLPWVITAFMLTATAAACVQPRRSGVRCMFLGRTPGRSPRQSNEVRPSDG